MSEKLPIGNIWKLSDSEKIRLVVDKEKVADELSRITDEMPLIVHHVEIDNKDLSPYNKAFSTSQNKINKSKKKKKTRCVSPVTS